MVFAANPKANYSYFILEKYEAGIVLTGTEIKSIREHAVSIKEAHIVIENGEMFILNMHVTPYEKGNIFNRNPIRVRKLLLHKKEILKLNQAVQEKGITIVPLDIHLTGNKAKMTIGLCKGKKLYDKRETIKKRDMERAMARPNF